MIPEKIEFLKSPDSPAILENSFSESLPHPMDIGEPNK